MKLEILIKEINILNKNYSKEYQDQSNKFQIIKNIFNI